MHDTWCNLAAWHKVACNFKCMGMMDYATKLKVYCVKHVTYHHNPYIWGCIQLCLTQQGCIVYYIRAFKGMEKTIHLVVLPTLGGIPGNCRYPWNKKKKMDNYYKPLIIPWFFCTDPTHCHGFTMNAHKCFVVQGFFYCFPKRLVASSYEMVVVCNLLTILVAISYTSPFTLHGSPGLQTTLVC